MNDFDAKVRKGVAQDVLKRGLREGWVCPECHAELNHADGGLCDECEAIPDFREMFLTSMSKGATQMESVELKSRVAELEAALGAFLGAFADTRSTEERALLAAAMALRAKSLLEVAR